MKSENDSVSVGTPLRSTIASHVETHSFIIPILAQHDEFKGLKICMDPADMKAYLEYRNSFKEYDDFRDHGDSITIRIYLLGVENSPIASRMAQVLNHSEYYKRSKQVADVRIVPVERPFDIWHEIKW